MTGEAARQVCEEPRPQAESARLWVQFGVIERQRKLHLGMLVRAMVISAGTPGGAYQADVLRSSLELAGPQVARSACSRWFDESLEQGMAALADGARAYARAPQVDVAGSRCGVQDCYIVDSTTVKVRDALLEECPGTGEDAALTGHPVRSVGCGAPVRYHCSPAREPDRRPLPIDASWRGCGLLVDLASASLARLPACEEHGGRFVIRLTDNGKPKVGHLARGQLTPEFFPGTDRDALLDDDILGREGRALAADVHVGGDKRPRYLRLGGVHTPTGSGFFLTNLPPASARGRARLSTACAGRGNSVAGWTSRCPAWRRSTPSGHAL